MFSWPLPQPRSTVSFRTKRSQRPKLVLDGIRYQGGYKVSRNELDKYSKYSHVIVFVD